MVEPIKVYQILSDYYLLVISFATCFKEVLSANIQENPHRCVTSVLYLEDLGSPVEDSRFNFRMLMDQTSLINHIRHRRTLTIPMLMGKKTLRRCTY